MDYKEARNYVEVDSIRILLCKPINQHSWFKREGLNLVKVKSRKIRLIYTYSCQVDVSLSAFDAGDRE
ncbi:hypothetical protein PGTUg99_032177 [Puccinia graminis f. sp. tritici]|uniref:Uncharacterized protein n=1 Tax=Puccinia graminis f. sp. tritici TaxID=56615 RepID=A0A5B0P3T5_PUCGR|nr:hypothetical protein PGTUg99_032177 [Puccinia graminis f. sp. tritici]